ncbi:alpha/beta fold hydrolase [Actinomadura rupiterrae]|uniref:alpha/beta fold hydrolase n=1 Tax=Actinomadura rupiterrae TaxID=559627 RepID=UPI0020A4C8E4|nr:alpha/beta hydrolase [Actinomadura rupiterrae]MCP2341376.1 pimeloyl-ACP methyl ester carboxylesterase [Actinomadura rupiterrae]
MNKVRRTLAALGCGLAVTAAVAPAAHAAPPGLHDRHPCPDDDGAAQPGFTCWKLTVPLDHSGRTHGTLDLQVGVADAPAHPKGTLLFLTGGPGQEGVALLSRITARMPAVFKQYRLVILDQRGTGPLGAVTCPAMQAQVSGSDSAPATPDAVDECVHLLGDRARFYGTDQTVGDLELLRRALGVNAMAVDGVSYGSLTAARYALAHPRHVSKLLLDSVVPHHWTVAGDLNLVGLTAEPRVLRDVCKAAPACGFDPAKDLATLVRRRSTAGELALFGDVVGYEFLDPTYRNPDPIPGSGLPGDLIGALHQAVAGDTRKLDAIEAVMTPADGTPATQLSAGLHAATLCDDLRFPWGTSATPSALRQPLLDRTARTLPASATWPYTTAVALAQSSVQTCLRWPAEPPSPNPSGRLPYLPTLVLNGDRDLSTPLEWARQELAAASPAAKLVVVKGAAHSIQNREPGHAGRDAVIKFLLG